MKHLALFSSKEKSKKIKKSSASIFVWRLKGLRVFECVLSISAEFRFCFWFYFNICS